MPKLKHLPNIKKQSKYFGPLTVAEVTDSHVTVSKEELKTKQDKKIPIHIVRPYFERSAKPRGRKRKATDNVSCNRSRIEFAHASRK